MIDRGALLDLLCYEPATGFFRWLINRTGGVKAGDIAGCVNKDGYIVISLLGRQYPAHRLAWFYVTGEWRLVDHQDCVGTNNRWENLRPATNSQNCANRRSRARYLKGAQYKPKDRLWEARIKKEGRSYYLGCFKTEAEAHGAYCEAARQLFGDFARAG